MTKAIFEIEWDRPQEKHWLFPDNLKWLLEQSCPNTKFKIRLVD